MLLLAAYFISSAAICVLFSFGGSEGWLAEVGAHAGWPAWIAAVTVCLAPERFIKKYVPRLSGFLPGWLVTVFSFALGFGAGSLVEFTVKSADGSSAVAEILRTVVAAFVMTYFMRSAYIQRKDTTPSDFVLLDVWRQFGRGTLSIATATAITSLFIGILVGFASAIFASQGDSTADTVLGTVGIVTMCFTAIVGGIGLVWDRRIRDRQKQLKKADDDV